MNFCSTYNFKRQMSQNSHNNGYQAVAAFWGTIKSLPDRS